MKKYIGIAILLFLGSSCTDDTGQIIGSGNCFEVTLVDAFCGQAVFKIEDPSYYHLGETANDEENVFYSLLKCKDMDVQSGEGYLLEIVDEYNPGNCAVCEALLVYSGDKKYNVRVVDICESE